MRCPWCNRFMFLHNNFCPACGNDLKGVMRPTAVSEKNLKKREIELQNYLKKGEKTIEQFNKNIEKWNKREQKKHPEHAAGDFKEGGEKHG